MTAFIIDDITHILASFLFGFDTPFLSLLYSRDFVLYSVCSSFVRHIRCRMILSFVTTKGSVTLRIARRTKEAFFIRAPFQYPCVVTRLDEKEKPCQHSSLREREWVNVGQGSCTCNNERARNEVFEIREKSLPHNAASFSRDGTKGSGQW